MLYQGATLKKDRRGGACAPSCSFREPAVSAFQSAPARPKVPVPVAPKWKPAVQRWVAPIPMVDLEQFQRRLRFNPGSKHEEVDADENSHSFIFFDCNSATRCSPLRRRTRKR
jgi:hypothetical protein